MRNDRTCIWMRNDRELCEPILNIALHLLLYGVQALDDLASHRREGLLRLGHVCRGGHNLLP